MKPITIGQTITNRQDASLGIYLKDVSKQSMIDINEEIKLSRKIKKGDKKAVDKLVTANLRFAISVAKQYQNKGLDLVDLIQYSNLGLIEAAQRYDESKGFKFISYAVWWCRQSIIKALSDKCRTVRVPMNQIANLSKINKAIETLEKRNERRPSVEEISKEINISADKITTTLASVNQALSLDASINDEEDMCLLDIIPNNLAATDTQTEENSTSVEIEKILNKLTNRESDVLKMSFGLGMLPMTLEEIAVRFGIGSERVRQIQNEAISKIRSKYSNFLKDLL